MLPEPSRHRLSRYGPLALWLVLIFIASTGALSGSNTSAFFGPVLHWLFPHVSDSTLNFIHFVVIRKGAHFTEYAILGLLCARAFNTSKNKFLRGHWFLLSLLLVLMYSLSDEFHQGFVPSRTSSIYDSMIDTLGGLTALTVILWRRRRRMKPATVQS